MQNSSTSGSSLCSRLAPAVLEDALAVERELARVREEIERYGGADAISQDSDGGEHADHHGA